MNWLSKLALLGASLVSALCCATPANAQAIGACCITSGGVVRCVQLTADMCAAQGGVFRGAGTVCGNTTCGSTPTGACCITGPNGVVCVQLTEAACAREGGVWRGVG